MKYFLKNLLPISPMWLKLIIARVFIKMLSITNFKNDIILYNELKLWIDSKGCPTQRSDRWNIQLEAYGSFILGMDLPYSP